MKGRCWI
ncbi:hypothetical protein VULLAG_LOCUS11341 [Vulpes lagopus]